MINCAHPTHFDHVLNAGETWIKRLRGLRANSSRINHAELDNAPELDIGDRLSSAGNMLIFAAVSLTSTCLAAAAERTTAMWTVSARPAAERRKRRDEFRLARSRCGRSQVRVVIRRRRQWRERARECSTPPEDSLDAGSLVTPQPGASMAGNVRYWTKQTCSMR